MENSEKWRADMTMVKQAFQKRLIDHPCVRCKHNNFLMRLYEDASYEVGLGDSRVTELICQNCGFIEKHLVAGLLGNLNQEFE